MRIHNLLDYQARCGPERLFARHGTRLMGYAEAANHAARLARTLRASGLRAGARVAFVSRNSIEHVLLYFGASRAAVVPVPLNFRLPPEQWRFIIDDARAAIVIASEKCAAQIDAVRGQLPGVHTFVQVDGAARPGWVAYEDWISASAGAADDAADASDDASIAYQFYTSGTTGDPKGAVVSQRALMAHLMQVTAFYGAGQERRILVTTPLSHAHAAIQAFISTCWGDCLCIMDPFDTADFVDTLVAQKITIAVVVPTMVRECLLLPGIEQRRFPNLRLMHYGAAPIAEVTLRRAMAVFGCEFLQGYGMTETTAGITFLLPADHRRGLADKPDLLLSAGRAAMGNELRVVDEHDRALAPGKLGEVVVRGPTLMGGYWERPQDSAQALRGGWMHTGDIGRIDAEGFLYIVDRHQDVINSGGENVYPRQVEQVLLRHPALADAAAIGVPDAQWGEVVKAVVVLRAGMAADSADILAFAANLLAGFQRPRSVEFCSALPYSSSGKLLRRLLRAPIRHGQTRAISGA